MKPSLLFLSSKHYQWRHLTQIPDSTVIAKKNPSGMFPMMRGNNYSGIQSSSAIPHIAKICVFGNILTIKTQMHARQVKLFLSICKMQFSNCCNIHLNRLKELHTYVLGLFIRSAIKSY